MNADHTWVTPEQAREQLAASDTRSLRSASDHRVHAAGTAVFGLSMGLFMASQTLFSWASAIVATVVYAAVLVAETVWVERAARTVPRGARRWSRVGIGASLVVGLAVVLPWLNLQAQTEPNTWPAVLAGALVVALPSLVAAGVITRGHK